MTTKYNYLKLSLRIVHGAKSTTVFSYPAGEKALRPSFDAPEILHRFINLSEFYVTGCHNGTRYMSFVSSNEESKGSSRMELTLSYDADVLLSGSSILHLVGSIKSMVEKDDPFTQEAIEEALSASGFTEEPLRCKIAEEPNNLAGCPCYRTYSSTTDLANILSFPRQPAYANYSEVVLVHVTTVPVADTPLPVVTAPLRQAYAVVCPPDVQASADSVKLTDRLTLTYTRKGFDPNTITFEVGTTNRYVKILGPALVVNDAQKAAIIFVRKVSYTVVSSKGTPVNSYTILINGRTATRNDGKFEVTSNDFNKEGTVNISVSSTNYFTTSIDLTAQELSAQPTLRLILVPEELPIVIRLDFGDGRLIQQELHIEKSSPEYRQLRAGSFHGFRAHRIMSHEPETYNVDMAAAAPVQPEAPKPAAEAVKPAVKAAPAAIANKPTEATVSEPKPEALKSAEAPKADTPKAEPEAVKPTPLQQPKSAAELRAERLRKDIPTKLDDSDKPKDKKKKKEAEKNARGAYANDIPRKLDVLEDDPDDDDDNTNKPFYKQILTPMILAVLAAAAIVIGIIWYLSSMLPATQAEREASEQLDITQQEPGIDTSRIAVLDNVEPGSVAEEKTDDKATDGTPTDGSAATATNDEKADIEYLNTHDSWKLVDLKSAKYRNFFNLLGEGNIDAIANADYFAVRDLATNKKAVKVIEYLWEAKGTFAEKRNVKAMQDLKGKETIDIHQLYELLARMQDAKPNKSERPQRDK